MADRASFLRRAGPARRRAGRGRLGHKGGGTSVTVTDFSVLALAQGHEAVGEVPDVGLAVATEWGVLIPVLRSVAGLSLAEVAARREAAVARARSRRLGSADAAPAFATLSNLARPV